MKIIPIEKIKISSDRQRQFFDEAKISELADSIYDIGLLHPIVVSALPDGSFKLIAGERRLRAIQSVQLLGDTFSCGGETVHPGFAPVTDIGDVSELEAEEAELAENARRADLTVQESALAIARLHKLRLKQRGKQTLAETAVELVGEDATMHDSKKVKDALVIAEHLHLPEVAKAKTVRDAVKAIEKVKLAEHRSQLAAVFDASKAENTIANKLIHGDSFIEVPKLPDATFDLVLTDPPYGIGADTFGDQSSGHNYRDDKDYALDCYHLTAVHGFRVTKPAGALYSFCSIDLFPELVPLFEAAGWKVWPRPLIWAKGNGMLPVPDVGPKYSYEAILFAYKPGFKIVAPAQLDVLNHRGERNVEHGAQKPVDLYEELIRRSVVPNSKVVDFFAGSGTIFPAANRQKVIATAIEKVRDNFNLALTRINETEYDNIFGLPDAPF